MLTRSGIWIDLANPRPEDILLQDIAAGLALTCRFGGHAGWYSVAQHSVLVAQAVQEADGNRWQQPLLQTALLHDAAEAYLGDVISPLKHALPEYAALERRFEEAIRLRFGLPESGPEQVKAVKAADVALYVAECVVLRGWQEGDKAMAPALYAKRWKRGIQIELHGRWDHAKAEQMFLGAAMELGLGSHGQEPIHRL